MKTVLSRAKGDRFPSLLAGEGNRGALHSLRSCGLIAALLLAPVGARAEAPPAVKVWRTTVDRKELLTPQPDLAFGAPPLLRPVVHVREGQTFQRMVGFGAAMTDASAQVIAHDLSAPQRSALMDELFGPAGLRLGFLRLPIGASDFSESHYSYDDMPAGLTDPSLARFSIEPARAGQLPLVRWAMRLNPDLKVVASPWSAPGWMKTSDSLIGGRLKPGFYGAYADYLTRYVQALRQENVPVFALTVQNEPGFEPGDYPGMRLDPPARATLIGGFLGPEFRAAGIDTQILDFDHNWDEPASPLAVLADPRAGAYISGVAWHCYKGKVAAQAAVHRAFPDKNAYFTECSGGEWTPEWGAAFDEIVGDLIIGSTRGWARGVLLWNLALDEHHGPHLGGCGDCRGVVTIQSATGEVTRNPEYYALGHASRFVHPGAARIASDARVQDVETVAFRNLDDGTIVLVALNTAKSARTLIVEDGGRAFAQAMPAGAAATFVWTAWTAPARPSD